MVFPFMNLIAQTATKNQGLLTIVGWVLLGVIVVAFLAFGLRDLARLSWVRISAISSVSFDESIRRRVLWITPLAILGAVVVSMLQNAVDPQDSIRQTTKICLFATGLVVTLVAIILASTNLQKEIETRVIYTIVTKPTTRLEIVLGKVWGFAKVSAAILLIMGVFTWAYLQLRAWRLEKVIAGTLQTLPAEAINRPTLEHYRDAGLLNAKAMTQPAWLQMLAKPPIEGEPRWMAGGQGQRFRMTFRLTKSDLESVVEELKAGGRLSMFADIPITAREPTDAEMETIRELAIPLRNEGTGPAAPATTPATGPTTSATTQPKGLPVAAAGIAISSTAGDHLIRQEDINKGAAMTLPPEGGPVEVPFGLEALERLFDEGEFRVEIEARSPAVQYAVGETPLYFQVVRRDGSLGKRFDPLAESKNPPVYGSVGRYGQQLYGGQEGLGGIAVYRFTGVNAAEAEGDHLTLEVKIGIERGGEGLDELQTLPQASIRIRDVKTNTVSEAKRFRPENNRIYYVEMPKSAFPPGEGDIDVLFSVVTPDQWLGVLPESVSLATGERSFVFNLVKSLFILWLMSILVVAIALLCSTFVSWPIAIVLTIVVLLGRWGVEQVGDAGAIGIGSVVTGQTEDVIKAKIMRTGVDALAKILAVVSAFLPDLSQFQATTDIERGVSVPFARVGRAGWVVLSYGLPVVLLAYLFLKRKEVAP